MHVYKSSRLELIGGALVIVRLEDVPNYNDAPTLELTTRFLYTVEGETVTYGYSQMIGEHVTSWEAEELFMEEVARWKRLEVIPALEEKENNS